MKTTAKAVVFIFLAGELTNDMTTSVSNVPLWKL